MQIGGSSGLTVAFQSIKIIAINWIAGADLVKTEAGDKVRIKAGAHVGERGVVDSFEGKKLVIRLEVAGRLVRVRLPEITNYSLAARKAWKTEPERAVGRRRGTRLCDRLSVTLRIDRDLWERFLELEKKGVIEGRTGVINAWFREKLADYLDRRRCPS